MKALSLDPIKHWDHPGTAQLSDENHDACVRVVVAIEDGEDSFKRPRITEDADCIRRLNRIIAGYNTFDATNQVLSEMREYLLKALISPHDCNQIEVLSTKIGNLLTARTAETVPFSTPNNVIEELEAT